jgi:hypothetical protein
MKTKVNFMRMLLIAVLLASVAGTMAQNQSLTQTVCVGSQVYSVDDIAGATFTWTISGGGTFTPPSTSNTITVNWTTPGTGYTLSVFSTLNGCQGNTQSVTVNVVEQPVGPTLALKTPDVISFCEGAYPNVSATFTAGSGGVGCTDEFQYRIDGGAWVVYTSGALISTAGATSLIEIQGRRNGCTPSLGCTGTDWTTLASWAITTTLPVTVTVVADPNPVCAGAQVTFTATVQNGGLTPIYVWSVNGAVDPLATGSTYTYTPANGDLVVCSVTSSETCGSPKPAISNTITMVVKPLPVTSPIWHN